MDLSHFAVVQSGSCDATKAVGLGLARRRENWKERRDKRRRCKAAAHSRSIYLSHPRMITPVSSTQVQTAPLYVYPISPLFFFFLDEIVTIQPNLPHQGSIFMRPANLQSSFPQVAQFTRKAAGIGLGSPDVNLQAVRLSGPGRRHRRDVGSVSTNESFCRLRAS